MDWDSFKSAKMEELEEHEEEGKTDKAMMVLINKINSAPDLVTTSSCIGRINLLEYNLTEGKKSAKFHKKWHRMVSSEEVEMAISEYNNKTPLWFKVEPFILHVAAKDIASAQRFLKLVRSVGVKRGGIQSISKDKVLIEVQGNGYMAIPVEPFTGEWNKILTIANRMMIMNMEVIKKMEKRNWK